MEVMTVRRPDTRLTPYLALDDLTADLRLARRLPRDLAFRYHALPVAEDGGRLTVAMADPEDPVAQAAVVSALGATPYVVQSDQAAIDALLAELWPEKPSPSLRLLVFPGSRPNVDEQSTYVRALAELLGARVSYYDPVGDATAAAVDALAKVVALAGYDLIVSGEPGQSLIHRLLLGPVDQQKVDQIPTSLLLLRGFRWPLHRILLVVRQHSAETNEAALEWATSLARPAQAAVTVLAVAPPAPALSSRAEGIQPGLTALLSADTTLGREMHRVARRLVDRDVEATLRLRQGPPGWQLRLEVAAGDYDLIIVGADSSNRWLRWLMGRQVNPLLHWADRPVLIAKPTPGDSRCR